MYLYSKMIFRFLKPTSFLQQYIKQYIFYDLENQTIPDYLKFIPSGNPFMVFNFGDSFHICNHQHRDGLKEYGSIVVGQQDAYYLLCPGSRLIHFCIIFQPTGFYRLFSKELKDLINRSSSLELLVRHELLSRLQEAGSQHPKPQTIAKKLDAYFAQKLTGKTQKHLFVEHSIELIHKKRGIARIKELSDYSNTCERNFRRRFSEIVGISPKKYIQIIRLQNIFRAVHSPSSKMINWSDFSYNLGYYDQMHFIKEFKKFCGESPGNYFAGFDKTEKELEWDLIRGTY